MNIATPEELALSAKFKKLEAEYNKLRDEVESYFFPKIQECVSAGRFDDALLIAEPVRRKAGRDQSRHKVRPKPPKLAVLGWCPS